MSSVYVLKVDNNIHYAMHTVTVLHTENVAGGAK